MPELVDLQHSRRFAPSSMARNEVCTAPAILVDSLPPLPPEDVTISGIVAHHVLEMCLKEGKDAWEMVGDVYHRGDKDALVTSEMADDLQEGIAHLRALAATTNNEAQVEVRLEMPSMPKMFGTSDFVLWIDHVVHVYDLKYGFILIDPAAFQLAIYALMAILTDRGDDFLFEGHPGEVVAVTSVMQPHTFGGDRIRSHDWTRADMVAVHGRVLRTVDRIERGDLIWEAGAHCRYCHVAGACPRLHQIVQDPVLAQVIADPKIELTAAAIDHLLGMAPAIKLAMKRVEELAQGYVMGGGQLSSVKLVKKKAYRKWDEGKVGDLIDLITKGGYDPYGEPKLRSPAQMEKLVPISQRPALAQYLDKTAPGLVIAPMDDPRTAVKRTVSDATRKLAKIASVNLNQNAKQGTRK